MISSFNSFFTYQYIPIKSGRKWHNIYAGTRSTHNVGMTSLVARVPVSRFTSSAEVDAHTAGSFNVGSADMRYKGAVPDLTTKKKRNNGVARLRCDSGPLGPDKQNWRDRTARR